MSVRKDDIGNLVAEAGACSISYGLETEVAEVSILVDQVGPIRYFAFPGDILDDLIAALQDLRDARGAVQP